MFGLGSLIPLKRFQMLLGLMAAASSVVPLGLLHMQPLQFWLGGHVPLHASEAPPKSDLWLCQCFGLLEIAPFLSEWDNTGLFFLKRKVVVTG